MRPEPRGAYADYLHAREKPASAKTIAHYMDTILSFEKSLLLHGKPATVGQLTPHNVRTWVADQRSGMLPNRSSRPAAPARTRPSVHVTLPSSRFLTSSS